MSFAVGDFATVSGLQGRADLNGQTGTLVSYDAGKDRWQIQLAAEMVLIKPGMNNYNFLLFWFSHTQYCVCMPHRTANLIKRGGLAAEASRCCGGCGREDGDLPLCSKCLSVRYCSRECQRRAWPGHKQKCNEAAQVAATHLPTRPVEIAATSPTAATAAGTAPDDAQRSAHTSRKLPRECPICAQMKPLKRCSRCWLRAYCSFSYIFNRCLFAARHVSDPFYTHLSYL
jgi:hypothetical protein